MYSVLFHDSNITYIHINTFWGRNAFSDDNQQWVPLSAITRGIIFKILLTLKNVMVVNINRTELVS